MMPEQDKEPPADPNIASVEENLFGAFGFHKKAMDLVRQSALDNEKLTLVADRINTLLDDISDEVKRICSRADRLPAIDTRRQAVR
jgi:hypothetical protein